MTLPGATSRFPLASPNQRLVRLFLCGDVMIGRGIDQIPPHPCNPALHEGYEETALDYVRAGRNRPRLNSALCSLVISLGVALDEFHRMRPDDRIINLETSITRSEEYVHKSINYALAPRMQTASQRLVSIVACSPTTTFSIGAGAACSIPCGRSSV
jgi:poly-gamma-glutamate capsule biosynthesis protein CapA/YwtB (metallophosphatase superfamily)